MARTKSSDEVPGGHGLAVVTLEVEITATPEGGLADQFLDHAHHFCALLVDGERIEVGDFHIGVGAHGMRHGAGVFGKLRGTQKGDIVDALDGARAHVGGKLGVTEHGEAFLQTQLKPVTAGHPVTGPVVEVLVGHYGFHALE